MFVCLCILVFGFICLCVCLSVVIVGFVCFVVVFLKSLLNKSFHQNGENDLHKMNKLTVKLVSGLPLQLSSWCIQK